MKLEVELGTKVTLHFALVLEDGDIIDSNFAILLILDMFLTNHDSDS